MYISINNGARLHRALSLMAVFVCLLCFAPSATYAQVHTSRFYVNRAENYINARAWQQAKREIDEGLNIYPDDPELRYLNGRFYYESGNMQEARYNLIRATQEDDQHFKAKRVLVEVEDSLHHFSSAVCFVNELLEFQPYDRDLWRRKISLYRKLGNSVEADAALERLAHIYPNDSTVRREVRNRNRENWNEMLQKSSMSEAADNLEMWIDLDPENRSYYIELANLYERMGQNERAIGAINRGLRHFPNDSELASKMVGILSDMGLYTRAMNFAKSHGTGGALYRNLLFEIANEARLHDPYEANGKLYEQTHDKDALLYLLNTSLTRGYEDDSRYYLKESMKRDGRTTRLLMKWYGLERKSGNEGAALKILQELSEKAPADEELRAEYASMMLTLSNNDISNGSWIEANKHLERALDLMATNDEAWPATISKQITVLGHLGRFTDARILYEWAASMDKENVARFASAYEDISSNRLHFLIEEERFEEALAEAQALLDVVPESETALRCCINMSQTLKQDSLFHMYAHQGYLVYPTTPYFVIKQAVSLQGQGDYAKALEVLKDGRKFNGENQEWSDPQLIAASSGISHEWAAGLMKDHMPKAALEVVDSALVHDPTNKELLLDKGYAYELMKVFDKAFEYQNRYSDPTNAELEEWVQHMRYLSFRSFRNRVDASYTHAMFDTRSEDLASVGHLYSIASFSYSHLTAHNTYSGEVSYKGIDGYHSNGQNESGGIGLQFMGMWEHTFNDRWSGLLSGTYATRFFNKWSANISLSYASDNGWTPSLRLGYRRTPETYIFFGANAGNNSRLGKYHLFLLTPSIEKSWERIKTTLTTDLTLLEGDIYYNVGLKAKLFVNEDNISSVSLLTGFGSFPELNFFEQTALHGISHTNAMVGFDAQYLCTRNTYLGLAGTWNTCYNPHQLADGTLTSSYRIIYSITLQLHVAF